MMSSRNLLGSDAIGIWESRFNQACVLPKSTVEDHCLSGPASAFLNTLLMAGSPVSFAYPLIQDDWNFVGSSSSKPS